MIVKTKQVGFTLIEMIIVIIVVLILISVSTTILVQEFKIFYTGKNLIEADWQGRVALERITRDLRTLAKITSFNDSSIIFNDINGEAVTYSLNNSNQLVYSSSTTPIVTLADNIQTLTFTYYDFNGQGFVNNTPPSTTDIRYITITLNIVNNSTNFNLTTAVYPWNKTN